MSVEQGSSKDRGVQARDPKIKVHRLVQALARISERADIGIQKLIIYNAAGWYSNYSIVVKLSEARRVCG